MAEHVQVRGKVSQMDFTPDDMEAVRAVSKGLIETCRSRSSRCGCQATNAEYGAHRRRHPRPRKPAVQSARRGTLAACRRGQDRADTLTAAGGWFWRVRPHLSQAGHLPVASENFLGGGAERGVPTLASISSQVPPRLCQTPVDDQRTQTRHGAALHGSQIIPCEYLLSTKSGSFVRYAAELASKSNT